MFFFFLLEGNKLLESHNFLICFIQPAPGPEVCKDGKKTSNLGLTVISKRHIWIVFFSNVLQPTFPELSSAFYGVIIPLAAADCGTTRFHPIQINVLHLKKKVINKKYLHPLLSEN